MNPIFEELRKLREQQNTDFEIHTERLNAHSAALRRHSDCIENLEGKVDGVQTSVAKMGGVVQKLVTTVQDLATTVQDLATTVQDLATNVQDLATNVQDLGADVGQMGSAIQRMRRSSVDLLATSEATRSSFAAYRQRTDKILDVMQAGALTGAFEQESRLESIERRVSDLEKRFPAA